jgi:hypothetical protein
LALLAGFDEPWRGAPLEVRRVATEAGSLSYALRWHGARPALLWELERRSPDAPPLRLTCPVLAPGWSSVDERGETLL